MYKTNANICRATVRCGADVYRQQTIYGLFADRMTWIRPGGRESFNIRPENFREKDATGVDYVAVDTYGNRIV